MVVIDNFFEKTQARIPCKPFQLSQMFAGKAKSLPLALAGKAWQGQMLSLIMKIRK
jgi:hypothetical protein